MTASDDVAQWLRSNELSENPFGSGLLERDPLLEGSWAWPEAHDLMQAEQSAALIRASYADRAAIAHMLVRELLMRQPQTSFVVRLALPFIEVSGAPTAYDCLRALARSCGETWTRLLPRNPDALLDLSPAACGELAELLLWLTGSYQALHLRLEQSGLEDRAESRLLLRLLASAGRAPQPSSSSTGRSAGDDRWPGGTRASTQEPPFGRLLGWISLRPPGLQRTYLIGHCRSPQMETLAGPHYHALMAIAADLAPANIAIKLFMPPLSTMLPVQTARSTWSNDSLRMMLRDRIRIASGKQRQCFADYFVVPPDATGDAIVDAKLVRAAHGSLSALLEIGNCVLAEHVAREPNERSIDLALLDDVLNAGGRP